jgi:sec-independent protein translocase protein TatC
VIAFVVATGLAFVFYNPILKFLAGPVLSKRVPVLYVTGIVTAFLVRVKVSMFAGFLLSLPVSLYQLWRFVTPGLEPKEKRYAIPFVVSSLVLFALGGLVAWLVLPTGIHFLLGFASGPLRPLIQIDQYLSFIMFMVIAFGVSFEFPLLLVFLAGVGVIDSAKLRKYRRHAAVIATIVGAVATPSQDPYSQIAMTVPLYILYELTILVIRYAMKK